jgi:hypothetical protein
LILKQPFTRVFKIYLRVKSPIFKKTTGPSIPSDKDLYYNGDATKWLKVAYSLKARYYLHTKEYLLAKKIMQY